MFNKEKYYKNLSKKRNEELVPIVRELIKLVAEGDLPIGDIQERDRVEYLKLAKNVLMLLLRHNVRYTDRHFIFQLIVQPFDLLREAVVKSLEESFNKAVDKKFGKEIEEFRLEDLDRILKEGL